MMQRCTTTVFLHAVSPNHVFFLLAELQLDKYLLDLHEYLVDAPNLTYLAIGISSCGGQECLLDSTCVLCFLNPSLCHCE